MKTIRTYRKGQEISYTLPADGTYTVQIANNISKISFAGSGQNDISEQILGVQNLGDGIQSLDDYCFYRCRRMEGDMRLSPQIRNINKRCFSGCSGMKAISYEAYEKPETATGATPQLEKIEEYAFADCAGMQSITLPESITEITQLDANAFAGSSLTCVTFLGIESGTFLKS